MGVLENPRHFSQLAAYDDNHPTVTSVEQESVETTIIDCFQLYKSNTILPIKHITLHRDKHVRFLLQLIDALPQGFTALDASRPWLVYWITHSLDLLGYEFTSLLKQRVLASLAVCWNASTGGFAGGRGQLSHLAPTYAAVNTLAILGDQESYGLIDREALYAFLMSVKQPDGSFIMHQGGEIDVRGTYCALSVAKLCNMLTPELTENCSSFIAQCQTYEGGMGGFPGCEAHGGYTFCAIAAMDILGKIGELKVERLLSWLVNRQMSLEGGFQGRTNKLVDGCYSFWQGGVFPILERYLKSVGRELDVLDRESLQQYILLPGQSTKGGLRDKPEKSCDFYHTCYVLSGLSICQYHYDTSYNIDIEKGVCIVGGAMPPSSSSEPASSPLSKDFATKKTEMVQPVTLEEIIPGLGYVQEQNRNWVMPIHPVHNIRLDRVGKIMEYFGVSL